MSGILIGIDIGTSAVKVVAIDSDDATVRAQASRCYPCSSPRPGWSEQDPEDWWRGTCESLREITDAIGHARVLGVSFSGQMHGSVLLAEQTLAAEGRHPIDLRPAILWNDQRTGAQCAHIEARAGSRRSLVERVGNAALPGFTLPKLLWLREYEPKIWRRTRMLLLPKDAVRFRLTGRASTDVGDASGTLLFDVARRCWASEMQACFDISSELLPEVVEACAPAGRISDWAARQTGLPPGTPVFAGSGDNMASAAGVGVVRTGTALSVLGTSGVLYTHTDRPRCDLKGPGRLHAMCAPDGDEKTSGQWCVTGCMLSAAGCLQWARDRLFPDVSFARLMDEARAVPAGAGGLCFCPWLTGERCPHPDPEARGAWIGLSRRHTRGHLVRAILEGVCFGMAQILDLQRALGVRIDRLRLAGGGAKDPLWRQLQADVFGCPVEMPEHEEGPAFGAALMAGVGAGVWHSLAEACTQSVRVREVREPAPNAGLERAREVHALLYDRLRDIFPQQLAIERLAEEESCPS